MATQPKLLFFVTEDWYFCSHRLPLAVAARNAGYHVTVVTRVQKEGERISSAGLKLIPISLSRRGTNPLQEAQLIRQLVKIYRSEHPDIVHHVALKPVLYGSLAARIAKIPRMVNAMAGLGYLFSSQKTKARVLRPFVEKGFRALLNHPSSRVILQNPDDVRLMQSRKILDPQRISLIRGSGVDIQEFQSIPEPAGEPLVVLASRMLWDKGVGAFVEAAMRLRQEDCKAWFVLVGDPDLENPGAIPVAQLEAWHASGAVEWWGHRADMPGVFAQAHLVCLPSNYGEGVPKVLIEAAACARAIVTTDIPGCREIVRHNQNGLLVPPGDVDALANALRRLIEDSDLRRRMGEQGRRLVEMEFSIDKVVAETLAVYRELLQ